MIRGIYKTVYLPHYAFVVAKNFTVHITCVCNGKNISVRNYGTSNVENGSFTVYGINGEFNWIVYGERQSIDTEPLKSSVEVKGSGPYRWI